VFARFLAAFAGTTADELYPVLVEQMAEQRREYRAGV